VLIVQSYPLKPHYCASSMLGFPFFSYCWFPSVFYKFREFLGPHDVRHGYFIDGESVVIRAVPSCSDFFIREIFFLYDSFAA